MLLRGRLEPLLTLIIFTHWVPSHMEMVFLLWLINLVLYGQALMELIGRSERIFHRRHIIASATVTDFMWLWGRRGAVTHFGWEHHLTILRQAFQPSMLLLHLLLLLRWLSQLPPVADLLLSPIMNIL